MGANNSEGLILKNKRSSEVSDDLFDVWRNTESSVLAAAASVGGGGKEYVGGGVEGGFGGVLDYADNHADADDAHGEGVVDAP